MGDAVVDAPIAILRKCRCCGKWQSIDDYEHLSKICNRCRERITDVPSPAA